MPTQQPPDRKKRIVIMFVGAAIALTFLGNFFWSFFKDFHRTQTNGGHGSNVPLLIFGGFFLVMIMAVLISVARGVRKLSKPDSAIPREEKPWLARPDWAAGKIKSSTASQIKMFAFMALIFCGIGAMYAFAALPKELRNGNYKSLIVLIFPAVGIGFLIAVVRALLARRRFGDCFFEPAQIPAPLGGALEGMILTGARLKLEQGLHLKISCIRRIVSGSGKNQSVQENILWQDEKIFKPEANLPDPEPGRSGIPVFFKLPANQPECYSRGNESVFWRLEAKSKMRGPDFCAVFDVPVFQIAGAIAEAADEPDPTAALQEPIEEIRRDERSKIQVNDGPDGREFYFPAARNPGTAAFTTLFMLVCCGVAAVAFHFHAPILFPIFFGLVGILLIFGTFNLWFKSSRVTIDSTGVRVTKRWLLLSRSRSFAANDVVRFDVRPGMQSGTTVFQDIKLVTKASENSFAAAREKFQQTGQKPPLKFNISGPGGFTLASGITNRPEADWLAQEMTRALGRKS
jgi:hypothetical protein